MDIHELGTTPISSDAPAGADPRYEPEYEAMQAEVDKLQSLTATASMDWNKVLSLSAKILSEKAKDVLCACYLASALIEQEGIAGLEKGVDLLKSISETFWEGMFPPLKRMRGRKNAVEWYFGRIDEFIKRYSGDPIPQETSERIAAMLNGIDGFLSEKMEDPPFLRPVINAFQMLPVAGKEEPPAPAQPAQSAQTSPATPAAPAPGTRPSQAPAAVSMPSVSDMDTPTSKNDALHAVSNILGQLKKVTAYYFNNDLANPMLYAITRICAWLPLEGLPPAAQGQTKIPAPAEQMEQVLLDLHQKGEWENLVKAAEAKVTQFLFWLDLSYLVYDSLDHLGPGYQAARDTVARYTAALLDRLPGIETYTFADGKPFAGEEAKKWLSSLGGSDSSGSMGGSGGGSGADRERILSLYQEAVELAKEKKLAEAIRTLQVPLAQASSGAGRMGWRLALVRLLLHEKKPEIAASLVEESLLEIRTHGLDQWDPPAALEAYLLAYSTFSILKTDKSQQQAADCFERISRLDPAQALRLKG